MTTNQPDPEESPLRGYPEVLTVAEVAHILRMTPRHVRALARRGELAGAVRVGGAWRVLRARLAAQLTPEK
ncbi:MULTISPECIES: helix-turn-helix domain-containing protein [unclassified Streptomyces]|uniref:helix-turn-helix domain-containing protein n=1 Tax=unclassified Streptomyces TaxID=2593676 RepID=UPI0038237522